MIIGEMDLDLVKRHDPEIMLLKEQSKLRNKIYHVCDNYDIASVKFFEEEKGYKQV